LADTRSPTNDFFGNVIGSFEEGIGRIGSDILPNWVAMELGVQSKDLLKNDTFNPAYAPPRVDGPTTTDYETSYTTAGTQPALQKVLFDVGTVEVTGGGLLIMSAIGLGAFFILKTVL